MTVQQAQELQLKNPHIPRARRPKKNAIWTKAMYNQIPERLLSYDILRHCRQHQWWNTRDPTRKILIFMQNARNCWFRLQAWSQKMEAVKKHFG